MYSGSSDGESNDGLSKKISQASLMPWARNLRRYIGSGAGLGSEALMELETKRILLEIFKERQQRTANTGTIPSFYRKKPSEGSVASRVQRLAKLRFLKKQSDLLLNADNLDTMWVCLRENCAIDDSTGAEKMNYEEFCYIASVCVDQVGPKCQRFFCPSNFMKFEKDESGRIAILPFYLYVMRMENDEEVADSDQGKNWFSLATAQRICDMFLTLDKDMNGTLSKEELQDYAGGFLTDIFIERVFDEHIRCGKSGGGNGREMNFESFLDFVLALENKDTPESLTYLFHCLDLNGRGFLTTADIHTLLRDVHQKWIELGYDDLCMEDVRDEIWDMVKPCDPLKITLTDLLSCKQGSTIASVLIDVSAFWAHENRESLLQEEEEVEEK